MRQLRNIAFMRNIFSINSSFLKLSLKSYICFMQIVIIGSGNVAYHMAKAFV
jgi:hypothetical protein